MGHSESKQTAPEKTFSPQIEVITEQKSTQFGKVKLVRDTKTGREMYLKKVISHNLKLHQTQLLYYYNRVQTYHPNLVNVIGYTTENKKAFCSEKYTIEIYLDPLNHTMQDSLEDHIKSQTFISEVQLQLLAQHMITVLAELQARDIAHGEINPANIFYNEEAYKLVDPTFDGQKGVNGLIKYLVFDEKALLAPEVLKQVPSKDHELRTNKFKADVFSLGATMLSLATLTNSQDLYNYEKGTMNYQLLESRIKQAGDFYSPTMVSLLRELLTIEEYRRPDFLQLKDKFHISNMLKSYNNRSPVNSYARDPLVKIADQISSETSSPTYYSPVKVPSHSVVVKDPYSEVFHKSTAPLSDQKVFYSSPSKAAQESYVQYPVEDFRRPNEHILDHEGESLKRNYYNASNRYAQKNF